jgi:hypothetical protein
MKSGDCSGDVCNVDHRFVGHTYRDGRGKRHDRHMPGQLVAPTQLNCLQMLDAYNVSTETVMQITADPFCAFNTSIFLPLPCELDTVTASGVTWSVSLYLGCELIGSQSLATEYSTTAQPVSLPLLLSGYLNILGDCGSLYVYQSVCKGYVRLCLGPADLKGHLGAKQRQREVFASQRP